MGNFREMQKFQEIEESGKYLCKHVEKFDFYGLKKQIFVIRFLA